jgi:hypothetical protein
MTLTTLRYVQSADGTERVELGLAEFQALVDAASVAEHGLPDVKQLLAELRAALSSADGYVDGEKLLAELDAARSAG